MGVEIAIHDFRNVMICTDNFVIIISVCVWTCSFADDRFYWGLLVSLLQGLVFWRWNSVRSFFFEVVKHVQPFERCFTLSVSMGKNRYWHNYISQYQYASFPIFICQHYSYEICQKQSAFVLDLNFCCVLDWPQQNMFLSSRHRPSLAQQEPVVHVN